MNPRNLGPRPKSNVMRRLGRDFPSLYELQLRAREKTRIIARQIRPGQASPVAPDRYAPPDKSALVEAIAGLGVEPSDVLMVHSSWAACRPLATAPMALIDALRTAVGANWTLCMPAYPPYTMWRTHGLDVRRSPSEAGLLTEVFRRLPGAVRSLQQRSVAALGPLANELTSEHHLSPFPSDMRSPYGKLSTVGAKVMFLGVHPDTNTMFHCAEDILRDQFPVQVYPDEAVHVPVVDVSGKVLPVPSYVREARWTYCCDAVRMVPYFADLSVSTSLAGVEITVVGANDFLERLLGLARDGVHMYGFKFPPPAAAVPGARRGG